MSAARGSVPSGRPAGPAAHWPSPPAGCVPGSCSGHAAPRTPAGRRPGSPARATPMPSVICQLGMARRRRTAVTAGFPRRAADVGRRGARRRPRRSPPKRGGHDLSRRHRPVGRPALPAPGAGVPTGAPAPAAGRPPARPTPAPRAPRRPRRRAPGRGLGLRAVCRRRLGVHILEPGRREGRRVDAEGVRERLVVGPPAGVRADQRDEGVLAVCPDHEVDRGDALRVGEEEVVCRSGTGRSARRAG